MIRPTNMKKITLSFPAFLGPLFLALIVFISSENFVRPFDDPKELFLYTGLFLYVLGRWIASFSNQKNVMDRLDLFQVMALCFVIYLFANLLCARPPVNEGWVSVGRYFLLVASLFCLAEDPRLDSLSLIKWLTLFAAIAAVISFYAEPTTFTGLAPIGNVTYSSDFLCIVLPWGLYFSFVPIKKIYRFFFFLVAIIITLAIVFYARKAAVIGIVAGLMLTLILSLGFLERRTKLRMLWLGVIFLIFISGLLIMSRQTEYRLIGETDPATRFQTLYEKITNKEIFQEARFKFAQRSLRSLKERPIMGFGYGSFRFVEPKFHEDTSESNVFKPYSANWLMHPHNEIVYQLFEGGVLGTILFFSLPMLVAIYLLRAMKKSEQQKKIKIMALLTSLTIAFVVFQFNPSATHSLVRLTMLLNLVIGYQMIRDELPKYNVARFKKIFFMKGVSHTVFFLFCFLGLSTISYSATSWFFKQAAEEISTQNETNKLVYAKYLAARSYDYLMQAGLLEVRHKNYPHAKEIFLTAYQDFPYNPQVLYYLSICYLNLKEYDEAQKLLSDVHDLYPFFKATTNLYKKNTQRLNKLNHPE